MKKIISTKFGLLLVGLFLFQNQTYSQVVVSNVIENFDNEYPLGCTDPENFITFKTFSQGGVSFALDQKLQVNKNGIMAAGNACAFLETVNASDGETNIGPLRITTPKTSFTINSFSAYVSGASGGKPQSSGNVTFIGTQSDGTVLTETVAIGIGSETSGHHTGIEFVGDLLNAQIVSLKFTLAAGLTYLDIDDLEFSTAAIIEEQFSIDNVTASEGNSGTKTFNFTITRSSSVGAASVDVMTNDISAITGSDYTAISSTTINFADGEATKTVAVLVEGNVVKEADKTFSVDLSNPSVGYSILDGQGIGTILNDDGVIETFEDELNNSSVFAQNGVHFESTGSMKVLNRNGLGANGSNYFLATPPVGPFVNGNVGGFKIASPGAFFEIKSLDYWIANGIESSFSLTPYFGTVDFIGTKADGTGTITVSQLLPAPNLNDFDNLDFTGTSLEGILLSKLEFSLSGGTPEINYLQIDNLDYNISYSTATQVSIADVSFIEGSGTGNTTTSVVVSRTNNSTAFSVDVASSDGSATVNDDYLPLTTSVNFTAGGNLSESVIFTGVKDDLLEENETILLTLSNATNGALLLDEVGIATILEDDLVCETFEDDANGASSFSESGMTFSTTGDWKVKNGTGFGASSSDFFLSSGSSAGTGEVGNITLNSTTTAFKLSKLDAWTATSLPNLMAGDVLFTGTEAGTGSTYTFNITVTPTTNRGDGYQTIDFTSTALDGVLLSSLNVSLASPLEYIDIDNFCYATEILPPVIDIKDATLAAITNNGPASTANSTDFETVCGSSPVSKTYTITNIGGADLNFTGSDPIYAVLGGTNADQFAITSQPIAAVTGGSSTTLEITYTPTNTGAHAATITLTSDDPVNPSFVINIAGTGKFTAAPTDATASSSIICGGDQVTLSATGCTGIIQWYEVNGGTAVSSPVAPMATNSFKATCTIDGCESDFSANSNTVTVIIPEAVSPGDVNITWTGAISTDWNLSCNWSPAWVPDVTNAKVIIPNTTNKPVLATSAEIKVMDIAADAKLEIANTGDLDVRGNGGTDMGIKVSGLLENRGALSLESATNTAAEVCIYLAGNGSRFDNLGSGLVRINALDEAFEIGTVASISAIITNGPNATIVIENGIGIRMDQPTDILTFTNEGNFVYNGSARVLDYQGTVTTNNSGSIKINSGTGISNPSGSDITNSGDIIMTTGSYVNGGTTLNQGLIQMPNAFDFVNAGTFTNDGILKANSISGITNNKIALENNCPLISIGATNDFVIDGYFSDAIATVSAGTYSLTNPVNTFIPVSTMPTGVNTIYAKITKNSVTRIVPFDFTNNKPTAVSISKTDICVGESITLNATCPSGSTVIWYNSASGSNTPFATGDGHSFLPIVGGSVSYYAACEISACSQSTRTQTSNAVSTYAIPVAPTVVDQSVCSGGGITLAGTCAAGSSIVWFTDNLGSNLISPALTNVTATATYFAACEGTNPASCQGPIVPVILNVETPLSFLNYGFEYFNNLYACDNGSIQAFVLDSRITGSPYNIQWQVDETGAGFVDIVPSATYSGLTNDTLTINNTTVAMENFRYRATISNLCSSVQSDTSILKINRLPSIFTEPIGQTVCVGNETTLSVVADGSGLSYQWQVNTGSGFVNVTNGGNYSNIYSPNLKISNIQNSSSGDVYQCIIYNSCQSVTSASATIVVDPTITILGQPGDRSVCQGSTIDFAVSAVHLGGSSVTYQWQRSGNGLTYTNITNNANYAGAQTNVLSLSNIPAGLNNYRFRCVMNGYCQSEGVLLSVTPIATVTSNPKNVEICQGNNAIFNITAAGNGLTYRWQVNQGSGFVNLFDGGIYQGATSPSLKLNFPSASINNYQYRCVVSGSSSCDVIADTSAIATITVGMAAEANTILWNSPISTDDGVSQAVGYILAINDILQPNGKAEYRAGNSILLNPGFEVEAGAVFTARIRNPCQTTPITNSQNGIPDTIIK
ncbi:Calx-beta domain-containing protein [Spirosomataceae bacterium TFI 002]|nr:Calx-beta domain-containing protein [Spirosomataceae bacterium TFI 002]